MKLEYQRSKLKDHAMVLSQSEFDLAYFSGLNKSQELLAERNITRFFFPPVSVRSGNSDTLWFSVRERKFNNEVIHNPVSTYLVKKKVKDTALDFTVRTGGADRRFLALQPGSTMGGWGPASQCNSLSKNIFLCI